jgi:hypothetical protein
MNSKANRKLAEIRSIVLDGTLRQALSMSTAITPEQISDIVCLLDLVTATKGDRPGQEMLGRMVKAAYR